MDRNHGPGSPPQPQQQLAESLSASTSDGGGSLIAQLTGNPYFTAGFGLAGLATFGRLAQQGIKRGAVLLRRRMLVELEITKNDDAYPWLLQWMYHRGHALGSEAAAEASRDAASRGLFDALARRITPRMHHLQLNTSTYKRADGVQVTDFYLQPGHGKHIMRYKNAWMLVNRERQGNHLDTNGEPFETVTLTTLQAHKHVFEQLFAEAHKMAQQNQEGKTIVLVPDAFDWKPFGQPKRKRPLESVVLEEGVKERLVQDLQEFIQKREWYFDRGIPYRRGYLLYGPPGTGKSSVIEALAGHLNFNIAMLNLSQRGMTDDRLQFMLTKVPPRTLVLLEDADAAWVNRKQANEDGYSGASVTFSGLLNALDGVASAEERILFLTTNHVERLDEALIRPGRVDVTVRIGEATGWQIKQLLERFYGEADPDGAGRQRFLEKARKLGLVGALSPAELQGLFLYNKEDLEGAIASLDEVALMHAHLARKLNSSDE
ncbi:Mitochondrial chaperone BCS1 [Lasiodiplodia hormozganensis]|uniref:Mitochondrial chaperone BCS1 n=1 Tax=Lasiodiplodia hormozganensis TaxID=869390 RepID=A0AA39Z299_9PEZI|nr:Mitochondrial chaperone BCS1 [Lasiodiplodia hormozganensis]